MTPPASSSALFRFDATTHTYIDLVTGAELPHITGMLEATGWIDDRWYTDASCARGRAVHRMTADYDLGALTVKACVASAYRGYLLAHAKAMTMHRPRILAVEEPRVHPRFKFGGRPDRVWQIGDLFAVVEIKSGDPEKAHPIQTALQAILVAPEWRLPAELLARYALYLKPTGRSRLVPHDEREDFAEARRIIKKCCT